MAPNSTDRPLDTASIAALAESELRASLSRVQGLPLPERNAEDALITPTLDEMAANPGAAQTQYRVTYRRVGRRGGRDGSQPPAPLTVWAVTADQLAEKVLADVQPYLVGRDVDVAVDLEQMRGQIYSGCNNGGDFAIEALATIDAEAGAR